MFTARNLRILQMIFLSLIIFVIDFPAYGQYSGGTGEPNDPYQIATVEDIILLGENPNDYDKHFILTDDIDFDPNLPGGQIFTRAIIAPEVNDKWVFQGTVFSGVFDGNGCTIRNLNIQTNETSYIGLFGKIGSTGSVSDLSLEDINISSSGKCISGLVGYNRGDINDCYISGSVSGCAAEKCFYLALLAGRNLGDIINCQVNGSVSSGSTKSGHHLGLLVGINSGRISYCEAYGTLTGGRRFYEIGGLAGENLENVADCHSSCNLIIDSNSGGSGDYGGLIGENSGVINRCYSTGNVSFGRYSEKVGGLVGLNSGSIIHCYASGDVSGTYSNWRIGGLVGWNYFGYIVSCYATGNVTGSGEVGGLVGNDGYGAISNAYATGRIIGNYSSVTGGLVGDDYDNGVSNSCFWDIETTGRTGSGGGEGLNTLQMLDPNTFLKAGWDFVNEQANGTSDVWQMPEGGGYPELTFFSDGYRPPELAGSGTPDDPYLIATAEDLGAIIHYDFGACYRLIADVNLAGITWTTAVIPSFEGIFDGNDFIISNLKIQGGDYLGLFGVLGRNAVVENLSIEDANIVGGSGATSLGMLAAENWGSISDCRITGSVFSEQCGEQVGRIVGYNYGTISNCDPIDYSGPYSVIITDPEATKGFLSFNGINFDEVWIPEETDIEDISSILKAHLESDETNVSSWAYEYILENLPLYDREYSGFVHNDSKYIICQMIFFPIFLDPCNPEDEELPDSFTIIFDGGCSVVTVVFDVENKTVVSIGCNGEA